MRETEPFTRWAHLYDALYARKGMDAAAETARVVGRVEGALATASPPGRRRWLDLACGTGRHLRHLPPAWSGFGLDRNRAMLAVARERAPTAGLVRGDMRAPPFPVAGGAGFDAVSCLFAALGYLESDADMEACVAAAAALLRPGGVLAVEPPVAREDLRPPERTVMEFVLDGVPVRRVVDATVEGDALAIGFDFRVGEESWREVHRLRLVPRRFFLDAMAAAGLDVLAEDGARSPSRLLLARRPR